MDILSIILQLIFVIAMFASAIGGNIGLTITFGVMTILNMDKERR